MRYGNAPMSAEIMAQGAATWDATKIPKLEESAEFMAKQINSYVFD